MHDPANCWQLAPSPDGKGWGEENLNSTIFCFTPSPCPLPQGEGILCFTLNSYNSSSDSPKRPSFRQGLLESRPHGRNEVLPSMALDARFPAGMTAVFKSDEVELST
jgi:hypothetical protein